MILERDILSNLLRTSYDENTPDTGLFDRYEHHLSAKEKENRKLA